MAGHNDEMERVCFGYTKKIAGVASCSDCASISSIENEVEHAVAQLVSLPDATVSNSLKVLSIQLQFAAETLAQEARSKQLLIHAHKIVEQKRQEFETKARR